jgi:hypothetical protein
LCKCFLEIFFNYHLKKILILNDNMTSGTIEILCVHVFIQQPTNARFSNLANPTQKSILFWQFPPQFLKEFVTKYSFKNKFLLHLGKFSLKQILILGQWLHFKNIYLIYIYMCVNQLIVIHWYKFNGKNLIYYK